MIKRAFVALAMITALSAPGFAYDACTVPNIDLSESDASRLANLDTSRTRGLGEAMRGENADERAIVAELFSPGLAPVDPELLPGKYKCRTIKLGGLLSLIAYQWFQCEIVEKDGGFTINKLTGSQNFSGTLTPAGSGYAYRGALFYGYEGAPKAYGEDPERNQVGCLSAVTKGNKHFVLELPFPRVESFHDVIELAPVR